MTKVPLKQISKVLNLIFDRYNCKQYIHPDPIEFLYRYDNIRDREIVALVASSLAYGRVNQIFKSVSSILEKMGSSPYKFIHSNSYIKMCKIFNGFKHRFDNGTQIASLLYAVKKILHNFGSINKCFNEGLSSSDKNIMPCLIYFAKELNRTSFDYGHLVPDPNKNSACKRLNLFLRWMVRKDYIDPGGWFGIPTSKLIVPLDTHMHKIGIALGFTKRRYASFKTAVEITSGFKFFSPNDPVKYDFSLTRIGILKGLKINDFLKLNL